MSDSPETTFPPAEDVLPVNAFSTEEMTGRVIEALKEHWPVLVNPAGVLVDLARSDTKSNMAMAALFGELILLAEKEGIKAMIPILQVVIEAVLQILKPGTQALGVLTSGYVNQVVGEGLVKTPGGLPIPGGAAKDATSVVFDQIMGPMLNLLTPSSPGKPGAGEANAQHILGTIISLHLNTWMVNIVSNLTGIGVLKWINSFDDAITSGINARGFSRIASKPYLTKFVTDPANRDLNVRYPLEIGSVAGLLKRYIRGNMTQEELKAALRGRGFDDEVVADLLLDNAKLFSIDDLLWLIDQQLYTFDQAVDALQQQGYPEHVAKVKLRKPRGDLVAAQMRSLANSLVAAFEDRRIDNPQLRYLLEQAGFSPEEVNAMVLRGAILQELPTKLTLGQIRELFSEGLIDLNRVLEFLREEGYGEDDADLLALMYFTKKDDRDQRAAELADRRRVAEENRLRQIADREIEQQAELLGLS